MSTQQEPQAFYDFHANSLRGEEVDLSQYQGKVVLVVNTASKCGFAPQFGGLEELYEKYEDDGLVVLGFPCNQFGNQEPGDTEAIESGCKLNYGVKFPMFEKIDVNGNNAHPLFAWLKAKLPGMLGQGIKWNFTKFLIGRDGKPIKRYAPQTSPAKIEPAIQEALGK